MQRPRLVPLCLFSHSALSLPSPANKKSFGFGVMAQSTKCLLCKIRGPEFRASEPTYEASLSNVCISLLS